MTNKFVARPVLFFLSILSMNISCAASSLVEDEILIRPEFIQYFKGKYLEVDLSIDIHNSFRSEEKIKKRKHYVVDDLPATIDIHTLKGIFPELESQLSTLIKDNDPANYEIIATISFHDSKIQDEIEGAKSLRATNEVY